MSVQYSPVPRPYSRNREHLEIGEYMSASIQVIGGVQNNEGGFKQSMKAFRSHHKDQGDQLLNIADGLDKDDPRAAYVHQQFPKMLYKPTDEKVVLHEQEELDAVSAGWREKPYPKVQIAVLDPATEKKALLDTNNQLQAQMIRMQEQMDKMAAALSSSKGKKEVA